MSIQEIEEKFKELLDAAHNYSVLYEKEKEKFPYRLNVIKELHDDENAHSRILIRLLQYKDGNDYVWLKSFIDRMNDYCEGDADIEVSNPEINTEHPTGDGRIDGYIFEQGKYAIIIENKIWDAVDQYQQIDRYVQFAKKQCDVNDNHIYVIYLTRNGSKLVSKESLSEETKETLGTHFLPMSFQYDILPWLEEDVLPNCKVKERCLETAVYQYIDYLKGIFGELNYQEKAQNKALKQILKDMGMIEEYQAINAKHKEVQQLADALWKCKCGMGGAVADKFDKFTKESFKDDYEVYNSIKHDNGYYQIYPKQWGEIKTKCFPHLEWYPLSYSNLFSSSPLTLVLHIEVSKGSTELRDKFAELLLNKAKEKYDYIKRYDERTFFKQDYGISNGNTFASMTEKEQSDFLEKVYSSDEIQTIIRLMNETIEEMKQQK